MLGSVKNARILRLAFKKARGHSKTRSSTPRYLHLSPRTNDSVYAFGDNKEAQCGLFNMDSITEPRKVPELSPNIEVTDASCGWRSSFIQLADKSILTWGNNNFGQLGLPDRQQDLVRFPREVTVLKQSDVQKIAAGRAHTTCIINKPPQVISMGFADVGQLGIGVIEDRPYQWPQVLPPLDKVEVKDIVSGMDHMVAIGARGDVYTWGLGGFGQLGSGTISNEGIIPSPHLVEHTPPLVSIFAGADHSGGVDAQGNLWVWGSNLAGQLGLPELTTFEEPVLCPSWDPTHKIRQIVGGGSNTVILTESGEVWTAGFGEDGTLGHGKDATQICNQFKKLEYFERQGIRIAKISCGYSHVMALTDDDRIFVWGGNTEGQLGLGDTETRFEPTQNPFFINKQIRGLTCGYLHSLVWGEYSIL